MQGKKLFIGNFSYDTTEADLRELFSEHGKVVDMMIVHRTHDALMHHLLKIIGESIVMTQIVVLSRHVVPRYNVGRKSLPHNMLGTQ